MKDYTESEILLVEDDPNDAELAMRAFKQNNLANSVHHVSDGAEALEYIFAQGRYTKRNIEIPPKVILLDLKLPKVNGLQVLEKIKSDERTKRIPVVVVTSSKEDIDLQKCYKLGVNSYIQKPVDFDSFVKVLSNAGLYWLLLNKVPA